MDKQVQSMPLWQSILLFGGPAVFGAVGLYGLLPILAKAGVSVFWNYMICVVGMFPFLLMLSLVGLRLETGAFTWADLKERFRIQPLSKTDLIWTLGLIVAFVGGQLLLLPSSKWLATHLPLPIPSGLPHALDPRMVKTTIPTEFFGVTLRGSWEIAVAYFIILVLNIVGEEFWWRGYIFPRQEKTHGRYTWLIHGLLWTLFHFPFWWNLVAIIPSTFSLSYVVLKTKNTTPGIIAHALMNGLGYIMILLGILGIQ